MIMSSYFNVQYLHQKIIWIYADIVQNHTFLGSVYYGNLPTKAFKIKINICFFLLKHNEVHFVISYTLQ